MYQYSIFIFPVPPDLQLPALSSLCLCVEITLFPSLFFLYPVQFYHSSSLYVHCTPRTFLSLSASCHSASLPVAKTWIVLSTSINPSCLIERDTVHCKRRVEESLPRPSFYHPVALFPSVIPYHTLAFLLPDGSSFSPAQFLLSAFPTSSSLSHSIHL